MGSYIDLPRRRNFAPPKTQREANTSRPKRKGASSLLIAALLVGGFFALTRPSMGSTQPPTQPKPAAPAVLGASDTRISPPQPDNTPLNETIILDSPLADSKKQDSPAAPAAPPASTTQSFSLRILNGSGGTYATDQLVNRLKSASLTTTATGNTVNPYDSSTIYYTAGHDAAAKTVAHALGHDTITMEENDIASPADVLYVIGANEK